MSLKYEHFLQAATILLSAATGLVITLPFAFGEAGIGGMLAVAGLCLGIIAGYKRRRSRGFFYLSAVALLCVSTLVFSNLKV
jgi:hypothetical protein